MEKVVKQFDDLVATGILLNGTYYVVDVQYTGDMVFMLHILGHGGVRCSCWCFACMILKYTDWELIHTLRTMENMIIDSETKSNGMRQKPLISVEDCHFDATHMAFAHGKALLKFYLGRAKEIDDDRKVYIDFLKVNMTSLYTKHYNIENSFLGDITLPEAQTFLEELDLKSSQYPDFEETFYMVVYNIIKDRGHAYGVMLKKYNSVIPDYIVNIENGPSIVHIFSTQFFNDMDLEKFFKEEVENSYKKVSIIGKHVNPLFLKVDELKPVLVLSDSQVKSIKKLHEIILIAWQKEVKIEDKKTFVQTAKDAIVAFIVALDIPVYHYSHVLAGHMVQDMIKYGSVGLFSCASFEALNAVIKRCAHRKSNMQYTSPVNDIDFYRQILERFLLYQKYQQDHFFSSPATSHKQYRTVHKISISPPNPSAPSSLTQDSSTQEASDHSATREPSATIFSDAESIIASGNEEFIDEDFEAIFESINTNLDDVFDNVDE